MLGLVLLVAVGTRLVGNDCGIEHILGSGGSRGARGSVGQGVLLDGMSPHLRLLATARVSIPQAFIFVANHTLRNNTADDPRSAQIPHSPMSGIGLCFVEVGPPQKAPCPIPLSSFMITQELIVVDWPVCFVQSICACSTTIVC